ncbi:MAG: type II methionyl aminopeptidase [Candidatus Aenigmatarchaeota archaeon]
MDQEIIEKYKIAGKIGAEIKRDVLKMIKPGMRILDLANFVENSIFEKDAKPAFPVNISINEIAAHYTPSYTDEKIIEPGDLVKIDIGTHVDGYIGDMAFTYCSEKNPLIEAVEKTLDSAISIVKPGVTISEIGEKIESTAKSLGYGVIVNLTGHTIDRYVFHGHPSIPNIANDSDYELKDGEVIAIEPFVTTGNGHVKESNVVEIYRFLQQKSVRLPEARKILEIAEKEYEKFPFAKRWLQKKFSPIKVSMALRQLEHVGAIESYPVLRENSNKKIAQAEHTIIVLDKPIITTKL